MHRLLQLKIRRLHRKLDRYGPKLSTFFLRLKYWRIVHIGKNSRLHPGVRVVAGWPTAEEPLLKLNIGENTKIGRNTTFNILGSIDIGSNTTVGDYCWLGAVSRLSIGSNVLIGPFVSIMDTNHVFMDNETPIRKQGAITSPIVINDDVWIANGAKILSGVTIGRGAVIAAGAVVTKDILPYNVVVGVPAKVIKVRGTSVVQTMERVIP